MCLTLIMFLMQFGYSLANNSTGCISSEPSCLKCGANGCMKCPDLIIFPSRKCANICPHGHRIKWSTISDVMGRMCVHTGNFIGLSNEALTVLAGVSCGALFCVAIIASAVVYVHHYKKKLMEQSSEAGSDLDDTPERRDFLKQLETLRPYGSNFLDMLNDTRRQLREQHLAGDSAATAAYRPVIRDLAKILFLINRPTDRITMPEDWEHLFNWAEKTLKRYKRMSEISQPQVAQLINFLQGPVISNESDYNNRGSTTMSTFKPDQSLGSNLSLHDAAIKNFHENYDSTAFHTALNPQWKFDYNLADKIPTSQFSPAEWKNSKEYLNNPYFFDDDFYQLGFRPQDEITTEL
ncbi:hypothetical protein Trydic_g13821 [Trypoxylus dichotomus]